jgi:HD-GYP domain-containing protein (c-di-GMP phosphodiesterase class II)
MELAMPLGHPVRPDRVLLSTGSTLNTRTIRRLREIGVDHFWIRYPGLTEIERWVSPALAGAQLNLRRCMANAFSGITEVASPKLDFSQYRRGVSELFNKLLDNRTAALFIEEMGSAQAPALRHAGNVCYISLLLGLRLDAYLTIERRRLIGAAAKEVSGLGVAALFHDLGMLRLPKDKLEQWANVRDPHDTMWRSHAHLGYEMIRGEIEPAAAAAVLHHHQRFDGSGFPKRSALDGSSVPLYGRSIHIFARVLAAADLFDQVRTGTDGGSPTPSEMDISEGPISTVRALRLMQEPPLRDWVDPIVLSGLLSVVPPFAPGSIVRLNTGAYAVVSGWEPRRPCRPRVRLIGDPARLESWSNDLQEIDLCVNNDIKVVEAEGRDVSMDQFEPTLPHDFDVDEQIKRLGPASDEARSVA